MTTYARAVVSRRVKRPVGALERAACQRHLDDLDHATSRDLIWHKPSAQQAIKFFSQLPHVQGRQWAGQKFTPEPWQQFLIGSLFGWLRPDGKRRFRRAYVRLARKNGKSYLASGLALRLAFFDEEPGAEVYCAATKREQAKKVSDISTQMVKMTPDLRARIGVTVSGLYQYSTGSKLQPLGADADTTDGLNISGAVIDELHAHKNRAMVDVIDTATGARDQPMVFEITTAGYDRESICYEHDEYSTRLLHRVFEDDSWFAFIASLDEDDDWLDERVWPKANPNLGVSVYLDDLRAKALRAQRIPADQNAFRRLHLNEWTTQEDRWIDLPTWRLCGDAVDVAALRGRACYVGLDLSATTDLSAAALAFPSADGTVDVLMRFWLPETRIAAREERREGVPLEAWARDGWLTATPGNVIDYERIREQLLRDAEQFQIKEIAFDPWNARQLVTQLQGDGFACVEVRQGFQSLSPPTKDLEARILSKRIRHGNHPVLNWCASNVAVETDAAGNVKPSKARARDRIDGIVALVMALDRIARRQLSERAFQMMVY